MRKSIPNGAERLRPAGRAIGKAEPWGDQAFRSDPLAKERIGAFASAVRLDDRWGHKRDGVRRRTRYIAAYATRHSVERHLVKFLRERGRLRFGFLTLVIHCWHPHDILNAQ